MQHTATARRQRGDVFVLVIPAGLVPENADTVRFTLNATDCGFECVCTGGI